MEEQKDVSDGNTSNEIQGPPEKRAFTELKVPKRKKLSVDARRKKNIAREARKTKRFQAEADKRRKDIEVSVARRKERMLLEDERRKQQQEERQKQAREHSAQVQASVKRRANIEGRNLPPCPKCKGPLLNCECGSVKLIV